MDALPIHKRKFFAFLSHAHADKTIVDRLDSWLRDVADIPIWYDSRYLPPGTQIATYLPEAITKCRTMIIVLSQASIKSGWVQEEYEAAIAQRTQFKKYRIIPIRIEECDVPGFLQTTKWIDLLNGKFDLEVANKLLQSLYYGGIDLEIEQTKDLYVSRTWRENESRTADFICHFLDKAGFKLIGDSKDQAGFEEGERVTSIISSCGGLVAILPDRGQGKTSKYMLKEIEIARKMNLPYLIIAEETVILPEDLTKATIRLQTKDLEDNITAQSNLQTGIETLAENWKNVSHPHYIFFGTDLDTRHKRVNQIIKRIVQLVTAMSCIMGDDITESHIQKIIKERIAHALVMIADISEDNLNTCIEAGIALGANTRFHLVARVPRHKPPFMFRDQQVWYYSDELELLGKVHRIIYPYRRRILNYELPKQAA